MADAYTEDPLMSLPDETEEERRLREQYLASSESAPVTPPAAATPGAVLTPEELAAERERAQEHLLSGAAHQSPATEEPVLTGAEKAQVGARGAGVVSVGGVSAPGTGRLLGLQQELRSVPEYTKGADVVSAQKTAEESRARAMGMASTASELASLKRQAVIDKQSDVIEKQNKLIAQNEEARQKAREKGENDVNRAMELARHAGIPESEFDRLSEIKKAGEADGATPEQRRAAAAATARMEKSRTTDPQRLLGTGANSIIAAISVGLGALGAAMTGTRNYALDIIDKAIERDIESQRDAFDKGKERVRGVRTQIADNMAKYDDKEKAIIMAKAQQLEGVEMQMRKVEAQITDSDQKVKLQDMMAGIQEKKAALAVEAARHEEATHERRIVQQAQMEQGRISAGMQRASFDLQKQAAMARGAGGPQIQGMTALGPVDKDTAKKAREQKTSVDQALHVLSRIDKVMEGGWAAPLTERASLGKQLARDLHLQAKELLKLGVLTGPDMDLLEELIPKDPTGMRQDLIRSMYKNYKDTMVEKARIYFANNNMVHNALGPPGAGEWKPRRAEEDGGTETPGPAPAQPLATATPSVSRMMKGR